MGFSFERIDDDTVILNGGEFWSKDKLAQQFGIKKMTVSTWMHRHKPRHIRVNKKCYVSLEDFIRMYLKVDF